MKAKPDKRKRRKCPDCRGRGTVVSVMAVWGPAIESRCLKCLGKGWVFW